MAREASCYQFDKLEVQPAAFAVLRDGQALSLEPKAVRVLLYLIEHRDRAVSKEELIEAVWDGAAVTDNALTRIVAQLRRELGDDARQARYIQTLPTLGYRFIAELRVVFGKNIMDLSAEELDRAIDLVRARNMEIMSIASPLLKCVLPNAPDIDSRFQQDIFGSSYTFEDQPRLTARAFDVLERTGARIVRVFSYWRTVDPSECFNRVIDALGGLGDLAASRGVIIGLENEHACNVATGAEAAQVMSALRHAHVQLIWDPANAFASGELARHGHTQKIVRPFRVSVTSMSREVSIRVRYASCTGGSRHRSTATWPSGSRGCASSTG